jgi:sugar lactone lactonase YvrE
MTKVRRVVSQFLAICVALLLALPSRANTVQLVADAHVVSSFPTVSDAAGNLYFADRDNHSVRKIDTAGNITTVAGSGIEGFDGDGGPATSALLDTPGGVALDAAGNIFIADTKNHRIREVSNGVITTYAGTGTASFCGDGGPPTSACLFLPMGIAFDSSGELYIADSGNNRVRLVSGGIISTVAGTAFQGNAGDGGPAASATLDVPNGVMIDSSGTLYIADSSNERIRTVSAGVISAFAATGTEGYSGDGGAATASQMANPSTVREDPFGRFLVADTNNQVIRQIASGTITSVAGTDLEGPALGNAPAAAVFDTPTDTVPVITGSRQRSHGTGRVSRRRDDSRHSSTRFQGSRHAQHLRAGPGSAYDRCSIHRRLQFQGGYVGEPRSGWRHVHTQIIGEQRKRNVGNLDAHCHASEWIQSNGRAVVLVASDECKLRVLAGERHVKRHEPCHRVPDDHDAGFVLEHGRLGDLFERLAAAHHIFLRHLLAEKAPARVTLCGLRIPCRLWMRRAKGDVLHAGRELHDHRHRHVESRHNNAHPDDDDRVHGRR